MAVLSVINIFQELVRAHLFLLFLIQEQTLFRLISILLLSGERKRLEKEAARSRYGYRLVLHWAERRTDLTLL